MRDEIREDEIRAGEKWVVGAYLKEPCCLQVRTLPVANLEILFGAARAHKVVRLVDYVPEDYDPSRRTYLELLQILMGEVGDAIIANQRARYAARHGDPPTPLPQPKVYVVEPEYATWPLTDRADIQRAGATFVEAKVWPNILRDLARWAVERDALQAAWGTGEAQRQATREILHADD